MGPIWLYMFICLLTQSFLVDGQGIECPRQKRSLCLPDEPEECCGRISCPSLSILNGDKSSTATNHGAVVTITCDPGYVLTGSATVTCDDGTWTPGVKGCIKLQCLNLQAPQDGDIESGGGMTAIGSVTTFSCNAGFTLSGSSSRTCLSDGTWSGTVTTCNPVLCSILAAPANGEISSGEGLDSVGSVTTFTCDVGFRLAGSSSRTCLTSGQWSGSTTVCNRILCNALQQPSNGQITSGEGLTAIGSVTTFTCNHGYILTGAVSRTCLNSGVWSGVQTVCVAITCTALSVPTHGTITSGQGLIALGSVTMFACNSGYQLSGSESRTCLANGAWNGVQTSCLPVYCTALAAPQNGRIKSGRGETTVGSMTTFECNSGYELTGSYSRTCLPSGTWDGALTICVFIQVDCPTLTISDASVRITGTQVQVTCNTGFNIEGSSILTCLSGQWSPGIPVCNAVTCPMLSPPANGIIISGDGQVTYRSIVTFQCNSGFTLGGSNQRTCTAARTWDGESTYCNPVTCSSLSPPDDGNIVSGDGPWTLGSQITFDCNNGFRLGGSSQRTCTADGTWSGESTACTVVRCPKLSSPKDGEISSGDGQDTFRSVVAFECNTGFTLGGSSQRSCQADGTWDGEPTTCMSNTMTMLRISAVRVHVVQLTRGYILTAGDGDDCIRLITSENSESILFL